jgi:arginine decarboxylase
LEKIGRKGSLLLEPAESWSPQDASEMYDVPSWGKGYFSVNEKGNVAVHPEKDPERSIDLKDLIDTLVLRGIALPILIRFAGILKQRLTEIHDAFATAIQEHKYNGKYCCVFPIKVNQQRQVVEEVLEFGKPYNFGLEAGSKPELLAVMALADNDTPIVCNGFKDDEYIEMAMLAQKIGRRIIPVVEKYTELALIRKYAEKVGVRPTIGIRAKLAARGSGRWKSSGGYRSKFGLSTTEVTRALEELKEWGMADCLKLIHFHLGSQITNIRQVKGCRERGGAALHRAVADRRDRPGVPGRGRRSGHRLRRFADRLRIERQLHAAGIRERRDLSRAECLRRRGRTASDDHYGERTGDRGVSQRACFQRVGCVGAG